MTDKHRDVEKSKNAEFGITKQKDNIVFNEFNHNPYNDVV